MDLDSAEKVSSRRVPGEPELWMLIFGDMLVFMAFFAVIGATRLAYPDAFIAGQAQLSQISGVTNTVVLLTSSLMVALGLNAARLRQAQKARTRILGAVLFGLLFCVIKIFEYKEAIKSNTDIANDKFLTLYFTMTGIHLVHVMIGLMVLMTMSAKCKDFNQASNTAFLEGGSAYWHMIDLVWVILFILLYMA